MGLGLGFGTGLGLGLGLGLGIGLGLGCSDVPDETLVSAHAASKTSVALSYDCKNWTSRGTTPAAMTCLGVGLGLGLG